MRKTYRVLRLHHLDRRGSTLDNGCRFIDCLKPGELGDIDVTYITIPPGRRTRPHVHRKARCFIFVVDGRAIAHLGGRRRRVTMNDFVLVRPNVAHSFEALDEPVTLLTIHSPALCRASIDGDIEYR